MAIINIIEPENKKLVINTTEDTNDIRASTVSISDNFTNAVAIIAIEKGIPGPPGPPGSGLVGPKGDKGEKGDSVIGPSGLQGPPGSGISLITITDFINSIALSGTSNTLNIAGSGSTTINIDNNQLTISSPVVVGAYAPINHQHNISDIINVEEHIDDRVYHLLQAGSKISLNYNDDDFNKLLIAVTGLDIGVHVQAHSDVLDSIGSLSVFSGAMLYGNAQNGFNLIQATPQAVRLLNDATPAEQRETIGLGTIATYDSTDFAKINGGNNFTGTQSLGDGELNRFSASINYQNTNNYIIQQNDNGRIVALDYNSSSISVSFANDVANGFNCLVAQLGSGQVRFSGGILNRYSHNKLVGQYSVATIVKIASNKLILSGDTTLLNSGP